MAIMIRNHLTGCTDGIPIGLAIDTGSFTTIHTVTTTTADFEEVWIWLANINTITETVTLTFGGTDPQHKAQFLVPGQSVVLAVPGWTFQGTGSPVVITGGSTTAAKVNVHGYINLIDDA